MRRKQERENGISWTGQTVSCVVAPWHAEHLDDGQELAERWQDVVLAAEERKEVVHFRENATTSTWTAASAPLTGSCARGGGG